MSKHGKPADAGQDAFSWDDAHTGKHTRTGDETPPAPRQDAHPGKDSDPEDDTLPGEVGPSAQETPEDYTTPPSPDGERGNPADAKDEAIYRLEIVANRAVQEDLFELLNRAKVGTFYTLFPEVQGAGAAGPRRGDHIWPEENFVFVTYVPRSEAKVIREQVDRLKERFHSEGIRLFATEGVRV